MSKPVLSSLLFALCALSVAAQEPPPGTKWTLDKVEFAGLKLQKPEDAIAVSGLQIGQIVDLDGIKAASSKLATSGLFNRVAWRYRYSTDRVEVTFEVEEARAQKLRCIFDNFVWFSDQEIRDAIAKDLPDFDGTAAQNELEVGKIKRALARLLREKKIASEIVHDLNEDINSGRAEHFFKAKDANLKICSIRFAGASGELSPVWLRETQTLIGSEYSRLETGLYFSATLKPLYRQRGYLKIQLKPVQAEPGSTGDCATGVVVTQPVEEGLLYHWDKAVWSGNQAWSARELDDALEMKSGAVANDDKIRKGMSEVRGIYAKKGYLKMRADPSPIFDDATKLVSYQVSIDEGPQYRMAQLSIAGLPDAEAKKLKDGWKLKEGELYNGDYVSEFLGAAARDGVLSASQLARQVGIQLKPDDQKLTVDVTIEFK